MPILYVCVLVCRLQSAKRQHCSHEPPYGRFSLTRAALGCNKVPTAAPARQTGQDTQTSHKQTVQTDRQARTLGHLTNRRYRQTDRPGHTGISQTDGTERQKGQDTWASHKQTVQTDRKARTHGHLTNRRYRQIDMPGHSDISESDGTDR
jgi:hypothetical protein